MKFLSPDSSLFLYSKKSLSRQDLYIMCFIRRAKCQRIIPEPRGTGLSESGPDSVLSLNQGIRKIRNPRYAEQKSIAMPKLSCSLHKICLHSQAG